MVTNGPGGRISLAAMGRFNLLLTMKGRDAVGIIESAVRATERRFIAEVGAEVRAYQRTMRR